MAVAAIVERGAPRRCGAVLEVSLAAEVEVDEGTGQVQLHRYISIADVGKAIHPQQCEAQEEGGVMMGIGHTFFEENDLSRRPTAQPRLLDYRIPTWKTSLPTCGVSWSRTRTGQGHTG